MTHMDRKSRIVRELGAHLVFVALLVTQIGCRGDEPGDGYYLRGRVFNGATSAAIAKAQLTLLSGQGTQHASSRDDGAYIIGPIDPSASYRLSAKAQGMADFEFTGLALPVLAPGTSRTLIGDVALYKSSELSPAFRVLVQAGDQNLPVKSASLDFTPALVGADPALTEIPETSPPTGTVIGAFAQPHATLLPNQAKLDPRALHAALGAGGVAEIAQDALDLGTTYRVRVDAGPDFLPFAFMFTPVRGDDVQVILQRANRGSSELRQDSQQYFNGRVYNGVTLERLVDYDLQLEYFDRVLDGTVDSMGRFVVGPLLSNADYTISVTANGYRNFLSHNAKLPNTGQVSAFYYDAFMYPAGVMAPAVEVTFALDGNTQLPNGTVRFAPRGSSVLFNDDAETPAGVNRQVWSNDEDLQQRALVRDFNAGKLLIAAGELVLGVEYAVSVFGVNGYAVLTNDTFRAGIDAKPSFTLAAVSEAALSVSAVSSENAALSSDGSLLIRFNHDVAVYPRIDRDLALRALNDAFAITSPDRDNDSMRNTLVDSASLSEPISPSYRGVTYEISGDTLTLKWDRERGLAQSDADPIDSVNYGGLSALWLYTGSQPNSAPSTLSSLLSMANVDVQLQAM